MTIEFQVEGQGGQSGFVDVNHVVSQLQQAGYNPQGASADGMMLTLHDEQGPYEVKTADALKNLGWQVKSLQPTDADYANVQPGWRAAVHSLPDDMMRQAYVEGQMRRAGVEQPQVVGNGRDWYVFNPNTSQWIGVTNSPEWEQSDLVEAGLEAPRAIASALGGGAGFALGGGTPWSIAGAAAGAGLAGGGVDALTRSALAAYDPEFRKVAGENLGAMAGDVGVKAAFDAGTAGLFSGAPMAAKALLGSTAGKAVGGALNAGPISSAVRGAGAFTEGAGTLAHSAGKALDNPVGRDVLGFMIPGVSEIQSAGLLAQTPAMLGRGVSKGARYLGNETAPLAEEGAAYLHKLGGLSGVAAERKAMTDAYLEARKYGLPSADAFEVGGQAARDMATRRANFATKAGNFVKGKTQGLRDFGDEMLADRGAANPHLAEEMASRMRMGAPGPSEAMPHAANVYGNLFQKVGGSAKAGRAGERFGHLVHSADAFGRGLEGAANAVSGGVIKGARYGGAGAEYGGKALNRLGTMLQPLENRSYFRYGAEENTKPWLEDVLRRRRAQGIMDSGDNILAAQ